MKKTLSILAILIFSLCFSQVKKSVEKNYIPKKHKVVRKLTIPKGQNYSITVEKDSLKKDTLVVTEEFTRQVNVQKKDTEIAKKH
ncbi:hypothetical protein AAEU33_20285 [Chryseobacterium sp. Chry.R1]|uniref:hypothetical protein n=1 Tax=Chryseobacterium sp. Chry.R1 TaxID=3139392 RepID=UPI0031F871A3